jgi:hypothetical protein
VSPSVDLILRRRHLVLVLLRAAAAGLVIYGLVGAGGVLRDLPNRNLGGGLFVIFAAQLLQPVLAYLGTGLALGVLSRRLAAWIVPAGLRMDGCPQCGYSLKNLKSPICPECGADVRSIVRPSGG